MTAVVVPIAPKLGEVTTNDNASFLPRSSESTRVAGLVEQHFPSVGTPAIIVFHDPGGLSDADLAHARQLTDWLNSGDAGSQVQGVISVFSVPQARDQFVSADNTTMTRSSTSPARPATTATSRRSRASGSRLRPCRRAGCRSR